MKELIEAYFNDELSVSSYYTEIDDNDVMYVVSIYNGHGCVDSIRYVTSSALLTFMWSKIK